MANTKKTLNAMMPLWIRSFCFSVTLYSFFYIPQPHSLSLSRSTYFFVLCFLSLSHVCFPIFVSLFWYSFVSSYKRVFIPNIYCAMTFSSLYFFLYFSFTRGIEKQWAAATYTTYIYTGCKEKHTHTTFCSGSLNRLIINNRRKQEIAMIETMRTKGNLTLTVYIFFIRHEWQRPKTWCTNEQKSESLKLVARRWKTVKNIYIRHIVEPQSTHRAKESAIFNAQAYICDVATFGRVFYAFDIAQFVLGGKSTKKEKIQKIYSSNCEIIRKTKCHEEKEKQPQKKLCNIINVQKRFFFFGVFLLPLLFLTINRKKKRKSVYV